MARLFFSVVGTDTSGEVDVNHDNTIASIRTMIKQSQQYSFPASDLTLYHTKRGESSEEQWLLQHDVNLPALQAAEPNQVKRQYLAETSKLPFTSLVRTYFASAPQEGVIHILVVLPPLGPRKRTLDAAFSPSPTPVDFSEEWKLRFRKTAIPADALPSASELRSFVETALPVKIPLASKELSSLPPTAHRGVLDKLFTAEDAAPCTEFFLDVVYVSMRPFDMQARSMESFISYWGCLVVPSLQFVVRDVRFKRYSRCDTALPRPSLRCDLYGMCVFRSEEHGADSVVTDAHDDLRSKHQVWIYGDAPYMLAYASAGYDCALYAIVPGADGQSVDTVEIGSFRTQQKDERLRLLLALLQLSRLFKGIVHRSAHAARDEFRDIYCSNGVVVHLNHAIVEKRFSADSQWSHIAAHLNEVYQVI